MTSRKKSFAFGAAAAGLLGMWLLACCAARAGEVVNAAGAAGAHAATKAEVQLRGPVHEAFASRIAADAKAGALVTARPPDPIREIPPRLRPAGDDVTWIPGYWAWDDVARNFLWVSGTWRSAPPDQRWIPGYWNPSAKGYRWVPGTWIGATLDSLTYLPDPPAVKQSGPAGRPPSADSCWVPGAWLWEHGAYQWRAGFWSEGRQGWVWIPAHYLSTPRGAVFVDGYWDYRLAGRGALFAPVRFRGDLAAAAAIRFTPNTVIDSSRLLFNLFARTDATTYLFGDYFDAAYAAKGVLPWFEFRPDARGYDPLLGYYLWDSRRTGTDLLAQLQGHHRNLLNSADLRPPATLSAMADLTARAAGNVDLQHALLGRPLEDLAAQPLAGMRLVPVADEQVSALLGVTGQLQRLAGQRAAIETGGAGGILRAPLDVAGRIPDTVRGATSLPAQVLPLPKIPGVLGGGVEGRASGSTNLGTGVLQALPGQSRGEQDGGILGPVESVVPGILGGHRGEEEDDGSGGGLPLFGGEEEDEE